MIFGNKIKELRERRGLLQRQLAAILEIDTPMFSKIERGERKAKREHVKLLSKELLISENELLTIWLADKVLDILNEEDRVNKKAILYVQREIQDERQE